VLSLLAVLLVQALLFADGGITVLGINALNIAVLPVLAVHTMLRLLGRRHVALAAGLGTFVGNIAGALSLGTTLVLGAGLPAKLGLGFLVGVQGLAGVLEGIFTAMAVRHLAQRMPSLIAANRRRDDGVPARLDGAPDEGRTSERRRGLAWAAVAAGIALALLPFASATPDALARVLEHVRPPP
jgi:cobalt/nickel transport system permease protein